MQPTLALSADHPGLIYLNGRFAGEICADIPLIRPVSSRGPLYLEFRPFTGAYNSMARKLVFSAGTPLPDSIDEAENLNIIIWPGNVIEIEFSPEACAASSCNFQHAGHHFSLDGETRRLSCDGRHLCELPEGAEIPEFHPTQNGFMLIGNCAGGKYLLTMDPFFQQQTGFLRASQLDIESDGRIRAVAAPSDLVGHASLETWLLTPEGLTLISNEPAWAHGAPRWPKTPEETVRAAVEAALAGLDAEAERYLSPALRSRMPLAGIKEKCDLCLEMKYAPPGARPCIGLMHLEGARFGRVSPLYFRAIPSGGPQGSFLIEDMNFE